MKKLEEDFLFEKNENMNKNKEINNETYNLIKMLIPIIKYKKSPELNKKLNKISNIGYGKNNIKNLSTAVIMNYYFCNNKANLKNLGKVEEVYNDFELDNLITKSNTIPDLIICYQTGTT